MNDHLFRSLLAARKTWTWFLGLALLIAVVAGAAGHFDAGTRLQQALGWISGMGHLGLLLFILLYIAASFVLLPAAVLTIGAGSVFGLVKGSILCSIAATLAATAAFLFGRYIAREWVARRLRSYPRFNALDHAVGQQGWKIVGLTRLSPLFPFCVLNYAYAITSVSFRDFFFASWLGMLPGTVLYVYIGSLLRDAALARGAGTRARTPAEWTLYVSPAGRWAGR